MNKKAIITACVVIAAAGVFAIAQVNSSLFVFRSGTPIKADEVNANFQLLHDRIEEARAQLAEATAELSAFEQKLADFEGTPGPQGIQGEEGKPGPKGETGEQGQPGDAAAVRLSVHKSDVPVTVGAVPHTANIGCSSDYIVILDRMTSTDHPDFVATMSIGPNPAAISIRFEPRQGGPYDVNVQTSCIGITGS